MAKRLEVAEALSTRTVNELNEKDKMIQEQAKLTEEKEKEGSSDALRAKDKEIMAATKKLEEVSVISCIDCEKAGGIWGAID